jgi:hypothetical protein
MHAMKRIPVLIALGLFGCGLAFSQDAEDEVIRLKQSAASGNMENLRGVEESGQEESGDPRVKNWNLEVGTGFGWSKGLGSGMGFYMAPSYTLPLNQKWALHGGLIANTYTGLGLPGNSEWQAYPTISSLSVFGAASYRLSERLVLHGAGVKQLLSTAPPPLATYSPDRLSLGATYHLGDNVSIGASLHMLRGNSYGYGSPNDSPYGSPLFWTPFGSYYDSPHISPYGR